MSKRPLILISHQTVVYFLYRHRQYPLLRLAFAWAHLGRALGAEIHRLSVQKISATEIVRIIFDINSKPMLYFAC